VGAKDSQERVALSSALSVDQDVIT